MKDFLEIISSILGIVISCITIYQFFAQRPSATRLRRAKTAPLSQHLPTVSPETETLAHNSTPAEVEHAHTRRYLLALVTFIVMPIVVFFILYFYTIWSLYSYTTQEAFVVNVGSALLVGSSLALMILLLAPSRSRAVVALIIFILIYSFVLFSVIFLSATIYFSLPVFDSSLAGGNLLAVIAASLVTFVILRGKAPTRLQYLWSIFAFALIFLITFSGPIIYAQLLGEDRTENLLVGGCVIALIVASISFFTILFHRGTTRAYTIGLVLFAIVYAIILMLLETVHSATYNGLFYLFDDAGIGASAIAFVLGGLAAFIFLKSRNSAQHS
jgi:hypothetical protein